jgi:nucleotide-binding universal stress UspA family protein
MLRVLVATDGSEASLKAGRVAAQFFRAMPEKEFTIIYVKDLSVAYMSVPTDVGAEVSPNIRFLQEELDRAAEQALQAMEAVLRQEGIEPKRRVEWGRPADVITRIAEDENFDLIVVGSSGMGQITGLLLGSISDRVVHRSKVPVLVVR